MHSQRVDYFPALTGLRGVAAGAVVLHHAWSFAGSPSMRLGSDTLSYPLHAPGALGFLGVDLFFVLSGFLLALPFLSAVNGTRNWPSLRIFAQRRARRVLPAFWAQLLVLTLVTAVVVGPSGIQPLAIATQALFVQELFPHLALLNPVYWSLPVEWWFYAWLPLLCWLFGRARWWLLLLLAVTWTISFRLQCMQWLFEGRDQLLFNIGAIDGLRSRIDQFVLGILAAWFHLRTAGDSRWRQAALIAALLVAVIGAPWLLSYVARFLDPADPWTYVHYTAMAALLAALVFGAAGTAPLAQILLANRLLSWLGKISYSLYLWHWPVLEATRALGVFERIGPAAAVAVGVAAALGVSAISYRWIERPFLHDK